MNRYSHKLVSVLLLYRSASFSLFAETSCLTPEQVDYFAVKKVYDGDTVKLKDGRKVRLMGVNTPELEKDQRPAQPLAEAAKQRLQQLLGYPATIGLQKGVVTEDRYKRMLAHSFTKEGQDIAATLVKEGLGYALVIPPNDWNQHCYGEAEQIAAQQGVGIWAIERYLPQSLDKVQHGGFQRIEGRVERVDWSRKWLWLDMAHHVSIQILKSDLSYFDGVLELESLAGKKITVQGWLVPRKRGYRMRLHHPTAIKVE